MTQRKKKEDPNKVIDIIATTCGFAPPDPTSPDGINDGSVILQLWDTGKFDVICTYYNNSCRNNCQIYKTIVQSQPVSGLPDFEKEGQYDFLSEEDLEDYDEDFLDGSDYDDDDDPEDF